MKQYMQLAIALAQKAHPSPNPRVGCILVKNNKIVGRGFHKRVGQAHAEMLALRQAGKKAKGATMFLTLEPCVHQGRTPPCVPKILEAEITRAVIAMKDPNPKVRGKGIVALRHAGIKVTVGMMENEAREMNEHWIKYITTRRPFVMMKVAATLDGKIATKTGDSKWITNKQSRKFVHQLRSEVDAVLVGIGTVLQDNPRLTARAKGRDPLRVILDSTLRIPINAKVLKDRNIIIFTTSGADRKKKKILQRKGYSLLSLSKLTLKKVCEELGKREVTSVLIEGGSRIFTSAVQERVVDKIYWFTAPTLFGEEAIPALRCATPQFKKSSMRKFGSDTLIEGLV